MLKGGCEISSSCPVPGCHVPLSEPEQLWYCNCQQLEKTGSSQPSGGPQALKPSWMLTAAARSHWDHHPGSSMLWGESLERGSSAGLPVAPTQTLGILHPPLCQWLLHLVCLVTARWSALVGGVGSSQWQWAWRPGIDLGGSGECCASEQSVDLEKLLHPFCREAQCKGDSWGGEKVQPN